MTLIKLYVYTGAYYSNSYIMKSKQLYTLGIDDKTAECRILSYSFYATIQTLECNILW